MEILVKRVYEKLSNKDGFRVLADRLWPRGVSKTDAGIDLWLKEMTPSAELRKWFHADKKKNYAKFCIKYEKELMLNREIIKNELGKHKKTNITIVTAVKDIENSHIPVLVSFLKNHIF